MHSSVPDELAQRSGVQLYALPQPYDNFQVCCFAGCSFRRGTDFRFCEILKVWLSQVLKDDVKML